MWEIFIKFIENNQFFQGGFVLVILSALLAYFRKLPNQILTFLQRRLIYHHTIESSDESFMWFIHWFKENLPEKKLKKAIISTNLNVEYNVFENVNKDRSVIKKEKLDIYFKPNTSFFFIKFKNTLILIYVNREKMESKNGNLFINFYETITIYYYSRKKGPSITKELIKDAYDSYCNTKKQNLVEIRVSSKDGWNYLTKLNKRPENSLLLPNNILQDLIYDIEDFLDKKKWYVKMGIPYKRGYLLTGPPGNGKTSLIHIIASKFNLNIDFLNLSNPDMTDSHLVYLMCELRKDRLLTLEDIDAIFKDNKRETKSEESRLTFSGVLNCLDGFLSGNQLITFLTTNHEEKLDPALIRPGRVDYKIHIPNAHYNEICLMFKKFHPNLNSNFQKIIKKEIEGKIISMSKVQKYLLKYNNEKELMDNLKLLKNDF